jgi:hypothetical protein
MLTPDYADRLRSKYPTIFRVTDGSENPAVDVSLSLDIGAGWLPLAEEAFSWLEAKAKEQVKKGSAASGLPLIVQCKEKCGSLRVNAINIKGQIWEQEFLDLRESVRAKSSHVCEICGATDGVKTGEVARAPRCKLHFEQANQANTL